MNQIKKDTVFINTHKHYKRYLHAWVVMAILSVIMFLALCVGEPATAEPSPESLQMYEFMGRMGSIAVDSVRIDTSETDTIISFEIDTSQAAHDVSPNVFTLALKLWFFGAGDTSALDSVWFHFYDEDGDGPMTNADGTSTFITETPDGSNWQCETDTVTTEWKLYSLRFLRGRGHAYVIGRSYKTMRDSMIVESKIWKGRL